MYYVVTYKYIVPIYYYLLVITYNYYDSLRFKKCITIDNRYNKIYDLTDLILILIDTQNNIIYFIKLLMKIHHFSTLILNIFF